MFGVLCYPLRGRSIHSFGTGTGTGWIANLRPLECKYGIRVKESAKSDCRFGILVKNYTRKVTSDVSYVTSVTSATYVS